MIEPQLLTCQEVMRRTAIRSRSTIWLRVKSGEFPAPVEIGNGRIRWRASDIATWIESLPRRQY